jgi:hypothetical protein
MQSALRELIERHGWTELGRLTFLLDGGVDWSQRPFAKRWSMRRLGRAGLIELIGEHVALRRECFRVDAGADEVQETTLQRALEGLPGGPLERHVWIVGARGRFLIELSVQGSFSFEFTDERDTKMLARLKAIGCRGSCGAGAMYVEGVRLREAQGE